ncbi:hypothetical protein L7F22_045301 [Adiantum nelumboides]|nr:hypothetical protein [Adiantum nelumboides]
MRVQCDVCENALAEVVCCADEAALCLSCDQRVHAANKLASKHQRLRLLHNHSNSSNSPLPLCDICQEKGAFIFCVEDRALVCRDCDVCIHAVNTLAAGHQRFLATGIQVALESGKQQVDEAANGKPEAPRPQPPTSSVHSAHPSNSNSSSHTFIAKKSSKECVDDKLHGNAKNSAQHLEEWQNAQSLDFTDFAPGYPLTEMDFSKVDSALLSDSDWMVDLSVFDEDVSVGSPGEVPQAPFSIYAAAMQGLEQNVKGKLRRDAIGLVPDLENVSVVPDLISFTLQGPPTKRQKSVLGS